MSYNGSGIFQINSTGQPVVGGTTILASVFNAFAQDIASGLSNAVTRDGQSPPTANLPMGNFKLTGLANGSARTDSIAVGQVQDGSFVYGSVGGTADAITLTLSPAITAYAAGQTFRFIASGTNTTAVTLNVNGVGVKDVTKNGTTALAAGDIPSGAIVQVTYDGTRFQLTASGGRVFGDVLFGGDGTANETLLTGATDATKAQFQFGTSGPTFGNTADVTRLESSGKLTIVAGTASTDAVTLAQLQAGYRFLKRTVYSSGSGTFTPDSATRLIIAQIQGAGGAGGVADSNNSGSAVAAGGGSAGVYIQYITTTIAASSYSLGADSVIFGLTATAGVAADTASSTTAGQLKVSDGAAASGSFSATASTLTLPGGAGSAGIAPTTTNATGGTGGASFFGGGGKGACVAAGVFDGVAAKAPGAGGGGSATLTAATRTGGAGGSGLIIVDEFI